MKKIDYDRIERAIREVAGSYTVADLIYWLRNGWNGRPFRFPVQVFKADRELEVNWNVGGDREVSVFDPRNGAYVYAPLNRLGEITWEEWREPERKKTAIY